MFTLTLNAIPKILRHIFILHYVPLNYVLSIIFLSPNSRPRGHWAMYFSTKIASPAKVKYVLDRKVSADTPTLWGMPVEMH